MATEDIKEVVSKYKISLASLFLILPSIVGGLAFIDSRYAHAEDEARAHQEQTNAMQEFRKDDLEDKVFILQLKKAQAAEQRKKFDPLDAALLERYQKKLDKLERDR